jgi:hypothetical protein
VVMRVEKQEADVLNLKAWSSSCGPIANNGSQHCRPCLLTRCLAVPRPRLGSIIPWLRCACKDVQELGMAWRVTCGCFCHKLTNCWVLQPVTSTSWLPMPALVCALKGQ